ncbi:MAG: UvrD-helicase domain-containing protein [Actinomycetales bacterium]
MTVPVPPITSLGETAPAEPFSLDRPIPEGTTVLEASAGTGKTWTIAAVTTWLLAQGQATLDDLLLVTFGRAATKELRDRVRGQLVSAHAWLSGHPAPPHDAVATALATPDPHERALRRERLGDALAGFDAATIATTHTFCARMLTGLGLLSAHDPAAEIADDLTDLTRQAWQETYLARYAGGDHGPLTPGQAREIAAAVADRSQARLEPRNPTRVEDVQRLAYARDVLHSLAARTRRAGLLSFDDLQTELLAAVQDPSTGAVARSLLRERYRVVMVDEFQDTDEVQWEILRLAFHGHVRLVLIGDPKQAIYAFRGGDVQTYLRAVGSADTRYTLRQNHRSDESLVRALAHLLGDLPLGDPRIRPYPVTAIRQGSRLSGAGAPVRIRRLPKDAGQAAANGRLTIAGVRTLVARDLARDVAHTLAHARLADGQGGTRAVVAADIAVLVATNRAAPMLREALHAAGVPAVVLGASSVFDTPAALDWRRLLEAIESPHLLSAARSAAITDFFGWDATRLAAADDTALDALMVRIGELADLLRTRGVAAVTESLCAHNDLAQRLLARPGGERRYTDLRHIGECLHDEARRSGLGVSGLLVWLRERIAHSATDQAVERSRRLVDDAAAVHIVTVHKAKGLEYPIVYLPSLADRHVGRDPFPLEYHDDSDQPVINLSESPEPDDRARHQREESGEDLRKLYVSLTRAASQVVTWWYPATTTQASALHRLLFASPDLAGVLPPYADIPDDPQVQARLDQLSRDSDGLVAAEVVTPADVTVPGGLPDPHSPAAAPRPDDLEVRSFSRGLDTAWRRTSYTGLTSAAHEPAPTSEPDVDLVSDEPEDPTSLVLGDPESGASQAATDESDQARAMTSPLAALPGGAAFGTIVHEVLEHTDPTAADLAGELARRCRQVLLRHPHAVHPLTLASALEPSLRTPLSADGASADADPFARITLADTPVSNRLTEVPFELPLAGGDHPREVAATLADLAELLAEHLDPGHPLAAYPQRLRAIEADATVLRGYLTGSIDAVLRVDPDGDEPRYLVVDYKTNRLAAAEPGKLTAYDYRADAMATAMMSSHYPLQALLYSVALHRFLRWRHPGYDPSRQLAGTAYLFLRGMCGPQTPTLQGQRCGVFRWQPGAELVSAASSLLAATSGPQR